MSGYKSFAVAGAGTVGAVLIEELLKLKANGTISTVIALSRSASGNEKLTVKGVEVRAVDYESPSSIASAVTGVDVVISTVGTAGLKNQIHIVTGAKQAGVKLFVPSDFGVDTDGKTDGIFGAKESIHRKAEEVGLPYAGFSTGPFPDFFFAPPYASHFGFDFVNSKFNIVGSGTAPASFTAIPDIARYVSYVLTALPKEKLENRVFHIEGSRNSFNDILAEYQTRSGKKLSITHQPREEVQEIVKKNPDDLAHFLLLQFDLGYGLSGTSLDNNEYPDWNPQSAGDVIASIWK